jgi:hypothetical protein
MVRIYSLLLKKKLFTAADGWGKGMVCLGSRNTAHMFNITDQRDATFLRSWSSHKTSKFERKAMTWHENFSIISIC